MSIDERKRTTWKGSFFKAWKKGKKARRLGKTLDQCPYPERKANRWALNCSRTFIRAWRDGWTDEDTVILTENRAKR